MIHKLLAALEAAGILPDPEELRDALWLANHIGIRHPDDRSPGPLRLDPDTVAPAMPTEEIATDPTLDPQHAHASATGHVQGHLYAVGGFGTGATERVRGAPLRRSNVRTRDQAELARALHPFKRKVPGFRATVLDEAATVTQIAEEGLWNPVLRAGRERWLSLSIVVDPSPSMVLWQHSIGRFQKLVEQLGLFRAIAVRTLSDRLPAPRDREAVLLLTDGMGETWRSGQMRVLLDHWAGTGPVAVCDLLPSRMWPGTNLRGVPATARAPVPGAPNTRWRVRPRAGVAARLGIPIPVLRLTPRWMRSWSRVLTDTASWTDVVLLAEPSANGHLDGSTPKQLVQRLRLGVSPEAFRLACMLSAAWLTLPVMRLVRDLMVPEANDGHLSEVFLSGLLRRHATEDSPVSADLIRYDFLAGVREYLNDYLTRDDLLEVVRETNRFIASRYGVSCNVGALLADHPESTVDSETTVKAGSPAHVSALVLARLSRRYLAPRLTVLVPQQTPPEAERSEGSTPEDPDGTILSDDDLTGRLLTEVTPSTPVSTPETDTSIRPWRRISSSLVHATPQFVVRQDDVIRPDGSAGTYERVDSRGEVIIVAIDDVERVAIDRRWIYLHDGAHWRLPGQVIDADDIGPLAAAKRVLTEEIGLGATNWTSIGRINCADKFTNHVAHLFLATGFTQNASRAEAPETGPQVLWLPLRDAVEMAMNGVLPDAGSAHALIRLAAQRAGIGFVPNVPTEM